MISLRVDWSFCIFLPLPMGQVESALGLAISPEGDLLYVVDPAAEAVAVIDTEAMEVTRTAGWAQERAAGRRAPAAVDPDGALFVASGDRVLWLDPDTLETYAYFEPQAGDVDDHAAAGDRLFVSARGAVLVVELVNGSVETVIHPPLAAR